MEKHRKPRPLYLAPERKRCPVCGEISYSSVGIHPQCAVEQCDAERMKRITVQRVPIAETESARSTLVQSACPKCGKQQAAAGITCECGQKLATKSIPAT